MPRKPKKGDWEWRCFVPRQELEKDEQLVAALGGRAAFLRQAPPPPEKATKSTTGGRTDLYLHLQTHDKTAATASAGEPLLAAPGIGFDSVHVGLKLRGGKKLELKTCDKVASGADAGFLECWLKVRPESKIAVTNEILPFTAFDAGGNKAARAAAAERVANEVRITAMVAVQKVRYYKDNLQVDFLSGLELATINSRSEEEEEEEAEDGVITSSSGDGGGADSDGLGSASVDSLSSDQLAHSGVPISKALEGERALRAIVTHQKAPLRNWVSLCVEGAKRVQLAEYVRQIGLLQALLQFEANGGTVVRGGFPSFVAFIVNQDSKRKRLRVKTARRAGACVSDEQSPAPKQPKTPER